MQPPRAISAKIDYLLQNFLPGSTFFNKLSYLESLNVAQKGPNQQYRAARRGVSGAWF